MSNKDRNKQVINRPIMVIVRILKMVVASAAKVEVVALYPAAQNILTLQSTSEELGYKQPAIPLRTDNNTANSIMNGTMRQRRSKAIDMRCYWLKDRVTQ